MQNHQWEIYVYKLKYLVLYEMAQKKITTTFILFPPAPLTESYYFRVFFLQPKTQLLKI